MIKLGILMQSQITGHKILELDLSRNYRESCGPMLHVQGQFHGAAEVACKLPATITQKPLVVSSQEPSANIGGEERAFAGESCVEDANFSQQSPSDVR